MTCEEYLSDMKPGYIVDAGSEDHLVMHELSQRALKITMELNNCVSHSRYFQPANKKSRLKLKKTKNFYRLKVGHDPMSRKSTN